MPIPFVAAVVRDGLPFGISYWSVIKVTTAIAVLTAVKWYCGGAANTAERQMHSKVIMITVCLSSPPTCLPLLYLSSIFFRAAQQESAPPLPSILPNAAHNLSFSSENLPPTRSLSNTSMTYAPVPATSSFMLNNATLPLHTASASSQPNG